MRQMSGVWGDKAPEVDWRPQGLELGVSTKVDRHVDMVEISGLKVLNEILPKVVSVLVYSGDI